MWVCTHHSWELICWLPSKFDLQWVSFRIQTPSLFAKRSIHESSKGKECTRVFGLYMWPLVTVPDWVGWLVPLSVGRTVCTSKTTSFVNHGLTVLPSLLAVCAPRWYALPCRTLLSVQVGMLNTITLAHCNVARAGGVHPLDRRQRQEICKLVQVRTQARWRLAVNERMAVLQQNPKKEGWRHFRVSRTLCRSLLHEAKSIFIFYWFKILIWLNCCFFEYYLHINGFRRWNYLSWL